MPNPVDQTIDNASAESTISADVHLPLEAEGQLDDVELERAITAFHQRRTCNFIVDSGADFSPAVLRRLGIHMVPLTYADADGEYVDDLWESISAHEFYERMRKDPEKRYTTSAVPVGRYIEVFEEAAKDGVPTIYLGIASGLSSSIEHAEQAAEEIRGRYPGFELYVLNSRCDSAAIELLAIEGMRLAAQGFTAEEVYNWARDARYFIHGYFTLDNLTALAAGGRIPPAAAQMGGKLDIKPELSYDTNGALSMRGMCRGRRKALKAILEDFRESYCGDTTLPVAIVSSDAEKDADWLEGQLRREKDCESLLVIRSQVSPILGCHVGPGMVALIFWGADRRERLSFTDRIARRLRDKK